jgi:hypothetical protein
MADEPNDIRQQKAGAVKIGGSIAEAYGNINVGGDVIGRDKIVNVVQTAEAAPSTASPAPADAPLQGLGLWIWVIEKCEGGDPEGIAERAAFTGLGHVVVKVADGVNPLKAGAERVARAVAALKRRGVSVWGWHYLRGEQPLEEARLAAHKHSELDLDGYIADMEHEFKRPGMEKAAEAFFKGLRELAPSSPLGVSSFHYPSFHREMPWPSLLENADFVAPLIYWEHAHNPGAQLMRSLDEYERLSPGRPVFPVGSAYGLSDWQPTASDLAEFIQTARDLGLNGAAFFSWDWLGQPENKELWNVLERMRWETVRPIEEQAQVAPPPVEEAAAPTEEKKPPVEIQIPPPSFERQLIQIIRNDEVEKVEDRLGFEKYAEAFVQLVQDERTRPPLTVGISGAWGSGKSFLLYRLYTKLDEIRAEPNPRWRWYTPWEPRAQKRAQIVRFNAWDYNASEAVWPGLVRGILEALEASASPWQRGLSRARRNLAREIGNVRREFALGLMLFALVIVLLYGAYAYNQWQTLLTILGSLSGLAGLLTLARSLLATPTAQWLTDLFKEKERTYGGALGYMEAIRDDIRELKTSLPEGAKVVVIIDDLDRCTADKIVDTLEAIKLLLSFDIFVVFLAVDSSVIARAVEKRYKDLLAEAGRSGYFYLDKIIQIPFRLPEPDPTTVSNYLFSLLRAADAPATSTVPTLKADALAGLLAGRNSEAAALRAFLAALPDDGAEAATIAKEVRDRLAFNGLRKGLTDERIYLLGEVWALLARAWPVTTYTMHEAVRTLAGQYGDAPVSALAELMRAAEEKAASHIPTQRFREMVDAPLELFRKAVEQAPVFAFRDIVAALRNWVAPYAITIGFTPAELEAFQNLSSYLHKNPRHIKRLVNTYSLIRMLAARAPNGELILNAPETMLKWLIISSQWPFSSQAILQAFDDELETRRPGEPLPENDDALARLHQRARERIAASADLQKERARLDGDPDVLDRLVGDSLRTLTSRQLDLLRAYAINFNPAENSLPQSAAA